MKEDFGYLHFDLKLSSWIFLSSLPLRLGVRPLGQNPLKGTKTTPLKQQGLPWVSKTPPLIDSQTVISLPFLAYLHTSTRLRHTFSLYKPGSGLGILETVFAMLVCYVTGVGLTEINSFYFHHPLFSFFLNFINSKWPNLVFGHPWSHGCSCTPVHWHLEHILASPPINSRYIGKSHSLGLLLTSSGLDEISAFQIWEARFKNEISD